MIFHPHFFHHHHVRTGERNVHLDLNPWWWLESCLDVIEGIETLKYDDPQVEIIMEKLSLIIKFI